MTALPDPKALQSLADELKKFSFIAGGPSQPAAAPPAAQPMDPSQAQGGAPQPDPSQMQQAPDPSQMQGGAPQPDPSQMQQAAPPPPVQSSPQDGTQQAMSALQDQVANMAETLQQAIQFMEQAQQTQQELVQAVQALQAQNQEFDNRIQKLEQANQELAQSMPGMLNDLQGQMASYETSQQQMQDMLGQQAAAQTDASAGAMGQQADVSDAMTPSPAFA
jgi:uncharacterized phage infection (PIP) family protein YhgE